MQTSDGSLVMQSVTIPWITVDVAYRLGAHVVGWLIVAGLDGRELLMQQRVNGVVLGNAELQLLRQARHPL